MDTVCSCKVIEEVKTYTGRKGPKFRRMGSQPSLHPKTQPQPPSKVIQGEWGIYILWQHFPERDVKSREFSAESPGRKNSPWLRRASLIKRHKVERNNKTERVKVTQRRKQNYQFLQNSRHKCLEVRYLSRNGAEALQFQRRLGNEEVLSSSGAKSVRISAKSHKRTRQLIDT